METGEVHERSISPAVKGRYIPEKLRENIDKFMQRAENLTFEQITAISRSIPSSNSAFNEPWYKVVMNRGLAQLFADVELFLIVDASAMEKLHHIAEASHKGNINVKSCNLCSYPHK